MIVYFLSTPIIIILLVGVVACIELYGLLQLKLNRCNDSDYEVQYLQTAVDKLKSENEDLKKINKGLMKDVPISTLNKDTIEAESKNN